MSDADLKSPGRWTRRPLFSPDQMLTAQQLNALVDERRGHSEMLMRALHGNGIIFGYAVELSEPRRPVPGEKDGDKSERSGSTRLAISCGMALDQHGRLLRWPEGLLDYCELANEQDCPGLFTLSVHYAERRVAKGGCGPCGDKPEWIEEGVAFSLTPDCRHADRSCPAPGAGQCVSWDDYICSRTGSGDGKLPRAPDLDWACEPAGPLCRIECSDTSYDAGAGIPIACVRIANLAPPECEPVWGFAEVKETCEVRPYVHRTPLLYELIRGCQDNLARVESLSWQGWLIDDTQSGWPDEVDWEELKNLFETQNGLTIEFSRPIRVKTVHPCSVFLTTRYWDPGDNYILVRRIPAELQPMSRGRLATRFRLVPNSEWVRGEFDNHATLRGGGTIELTVRGQMLRDECGNMLNAVPLFYAPATPVQACPGGDFVAVFNFGPAPEGYGKREPEPVREPEQPRRRIR